MSICMYVFEDGVPGCFEGLNKVPLDFVCRYTYFGLSPYRYRGYFMKTPGALRVIIHTCIHTYTHFSLFSLQMYL